MKKKNANALQLCYVDQNIKSMKIFNLGEPIIIKGKSHDFYTQTTNDIQDDNDEGEEEDTNNDTFVLTLISRHIVAQYGTTRPPDEIKKVKDQVLALSTNQNLQSLYKAWVIIKENNVFLFIVTDSKHRDNRRGIKKTVLKRSLFRSAPLH